jgi:hypothetical protein
VFRVSFASAIDHDLPREVVSVAGGIVKSTANTKLRIAFCHQSEAIEKTVSGTNQQVS